VPAYSYLATAVLAYFCGSVPTGFLVGWAKGVDIRKVGSGNLGATNVFRTLGKGPGILVLLIDAAKGALPVLALPGLFAGHADPVWLRLIAALCAVLGHNYTCWLGFKGGKGIATSAGVLAALVPAAFLCTLLTWIVVFAASRYVSLASMCAAGILPVATVLASEPLPIIGLNLLLGLLAIWKHKPNIQRLLAGTENRIGRKNPGTPTPEAKP
jgi:glycerol-3-phosphate acyltransferase PlsY